MSQSGASQIAVIIPYYGKWPGYLNLYLESCRKNTLLDIIFITDLRPVDNAPANVKFLEMPYAQLLKRIEIITGISLGHVKPYKLCDFRPLYGAIFANELAPYTFWAYGDIDLIYGDVSSFLTEELLRLNDVFTFRADHLQGPLTVYRNTSYINSLYQKSEHYKDILQNASYLSFDEFGSSAFHINKKPLNDCVNDNISVIVMKEAALGNLKLWMQPCSKEVISRTGEILCYNNGIITDVASNCKYIFYHWVIEKRALWFKYPYWTDVPSQFYVSATGFYSVKEYRYYTLINFWRKFVGLINWSLLKGWNYLKRRAGIKVTLDTYPEAGYVKYLSE